MQLLIGSIATRGGVIGLKSSDSGNFFIKRYLINKNHYLLKAPFFKEINASIVPNRNGYMFLKCLEYKRN